MNKLHVLGLAGLAVFAGPLLAADVPDFQIGVRVGSEMNDHYDDTLTSSTINADTPYGLTFGWNFSDRWGVEVGYTDLGDTVSFGIADAGFELDSDIVTAGIAYRHPLSEHFELLSGVGVFNLNESGHFISIAGPVPLDRSDTSAYVEVGARYRFDGPFSLRASYQWFNFDRGGEGTPWLGFEVGF